MNLSYFFVKCLLDRVFAFLLIIFLFPIFATTYIIVYLKLGPPVIFRQTRIGFKNFPFINFKFRTMRLNSSSIPKSDTERLTPFGSFLRSVSIDELPSLYSILKGDMSFVGPRPLLPEYLPLYDKVQITRHDVLPGLTGLAQVRGRNLLDWDSKFALDVYYCQNMSFVLDMSVLLWSIIVVLLRVGITSKGSTTSAPFQGS